MIKSPSSIPRSLLTLLFLVVLVRGASIADVPDGEEPLVGGSDSHRANNIDPQQQILPTSRRSLTSVMGGAVRNDRSNCTTDGEYITCLDDIEFGRRDGQERSKIDFTFRCLLDDYIGFDFQAKPELCKCWATITNEWTREVRECACAVCPNGRAAATALDCTMWVNNPFIVGPCSSLDCDGRCNGTGVGAVNQPTPSPYVSEGDPDGTSLRSSGGGGTSNVWKVRRNGIMMFLSMMMPMGLTLGGLL